MPRGPLADLDLNLLVALDLLLREQNVTAVADHLGVTQSAMSHTLQRLRTHWNDPLLVRRGGQMTRTALAERLAPELAAALDGIERLVASRSEFHPATSTRAFTLFASDYAQAIVLPALLDRLRAAAPHVDLAIRAVRDPERALAEHPGSLFVGPSRDALASLVRRRLFRDRLVCVMRDGHPLAGGPLTLEQYTAAHHLLVSPRARQGSLVDDALRGRGLRRRVVLEVPHFLVAPLVIAQSDLLLTTPQRLADLLATKFALHVTVLPFETGPIEFEQLWHRRDHDDAGHAWLRAQIVAATGSRRRG